MEDSRGHGLRLLKKNALLLYDLYHSMSLKSMTENKFFDSKILWEGKYLRCLSITYRASDGNLRNWEALERVNCDGIVAVVPVTDDGCTLLIRQFRPPVNNYVIEFPAGLNDKGEKLEDAALRELIEETGYGARELIFLAKGPLSSGASTEILTVYIAKGLEYKGVNGRDESEDIEVLKIPVNDVYERLAQLTENGDYIDLKIPGLLEMAKKHI